MSYSVKEIYFTLQGEGAQTGRAAVFLRFAGCNLWSGRDEDRAGAACTFCDTDFIGMDGPGGGRFDTATQLAQAVLAEWPEEAGGHPYVVCTGGEPALQLDEAAIKALHAAGLEIGIETNGTLPLPDGLDWVCVSPKGINPLVVTQGDELKLVFPQADAPPERFADLAFRHHFLQPLDGPDQVANTQAAASYCIKHPHWRLSLQTHKLIGLP